MVWTQEQVAELLLEKRRRLLVLMSECDLRSVQTAVEMAAGDGTGAMALREMAPLATVCAVDRRVEFFRKRLIDEGIAGIQLICSDVTRVGLRDSSVDFVLFHNVLRHLGPESVSLCLQEARRVLTESGRCLIVEGVSNPKDLQQEHLRVFGELAYHVAMALGERPEGILTEEEVNRYTRDAGLIAVRDETREQLAAEVSPENWESMRDDLLADINRLDEDRAFPFRSRVETLDGLIRGSGLRLLPQRILLCRARWGAGRPVSAGEGVA